MIRALEQGTPCVAPRTSFTEAIAGRLTERLLVADDDVDAWAAAVVAGHDLCEPWGRRADEVRAETLAAYEAWWEAC
jgi:hypothetical protein